MRKGEDGQFYCLGCDYVNRNKNTVKGRLSLVWSVKGRLSLPVNMPVKLPVRVGFIKQTLRPTEVKILILVLCIYFPVALVTDPDF
jgi:hypothetical protein